MKYPPKTLLPSLLFTLAGGIVAWLIWSTLAPSQAPMPMAPTPALPAGPITLLIASVAPDPDKVELGRRLFHDPRLSRDDSISCAHCHDLDRGGVDGLPRSLGIDGQTSLVNAPTVYNSGFNFVQFWDGRARTLEEQVDGPVNSPLEMGSNWDQVLGKLHADPAYPADFARLYPDGLTPDSIRKAIADFVRSLVTPSRFDRWLQGDKTAIDADEAAGYELFKRYGCAACHQGANVGGNMYEKIGIMGDYFKDRGRGIEEADWGRYRVTRRDDHRHEFKVPSLRNVALTAPYFHDGDVPTLGQAIILMGRYQLGYDIPGADVLLIARFLESLSGERLLADQAEVQK